MISPTETVVSPKICTKNCKDFCLVAGSWKLSVVVVTVQKSLQYLVHIFFKNDDFINSF